MIGQIFRAIVQPDQKDWLEKVDMAEFAINSSISATTGYAPFETAVDVVMTVLDDDSDENSQPGLCSVAFYQMFLT